MLKIIVVERPEMVLGLNYGVHREGESKAICFCYSLADATTISEALNSAAPVNVAEIMPAAMSEASPTRRRKQTATKAPPKRSRAQKKK
jgi:hypothetical protein